MNEVAFGDFATWTSTAVALISAVVAVKYSARADRYQHEAAAQAEKLSQYAEKSHRLEIRSWTDQHFDSVRAWADRVCCAISAAIHLVEAADQVAVQKFDVLVQLSALVDSGRWYFPNFAHDLRGLHKEPAYRGVRQPVLDDVVAAYNLLKLGEPSAETKEKLVAAQRRFVSRIQDVLDPRQYSDEVQKTLAEFEASSRMRHSADNATVPFVATGNQAPS